MNPLHLKFKQETGMSPETLWPWIQGNTAALKEAKDTIDNIEYEYTNIISIVPSADYVKWLEDQLLTN